MTNTKAPLHHPYNPTPENERKFKEGLKELRAQHTPAPWTTSLSQSTTWLYVCDKKDEVVARVRTQDSGEANARLIAASPLMYNYVASKANSGDTEAQDIINQIEGK